MSNALARRQRFCESSQFTAVFNAARRFSIGAFTALVRVNDLGYARLGTVVARKAAARAVDRNRAKRMVRESFRCNQSQLATLDVVVLAKPGISNKTNKDLIGDLEAMWSRIARWQSSSSS